MNIFYNKIIAGFLTACFSFMLNNYLMRILGASSYGLYAYVLSTLNSVFMFLLFGTDAAFSVSYSKYKKNFSFIWAFLVYNILSMLMTGILIHFLFLLNLNQEYIGLSRLSFAFGILLIVFFNNMTLSYSVICDINLMTRKNENVKLVVRGLQFLLLIFISQYVSKSIEVVIAVLVCNAMLLFIAQLLFGNDIWGYSNFTSCSREATLPSMHVLLSIGLPLFIASLFGIIIGQAERTLLVNFSGLSEFGNFSFVTQLSLFTTLLITSFLALLQRVVSSFVILNDTESLRKMFISLICSAFIFISAICVFIFVNGDLIFTLLGGESYPSSRDSFTIYSLYPIHQGIGQIVTLFMLTLGFQKTFRNISFFTSAFGFILLFLLITGYVFNLRLGSLGYAVKFLVIQLISVSLMCKVVMQYFNINFFRFFFYQILALVLLFLLAIISSFIFTLFFENRILLFFSSGITYLCIIFSIIRSSKFKVYFIDIYFFIKTNFS
jgi:O-antigen/teichoic acid export membrane protein